MKFLVLITLFYLVNAYTYNTWKTEFIRTDQDTMYVLANLDNQVATVSEAHGYGMMVSVYHNDKTTFDKLVNYYNKYKNDNSFLSWRQHFVTGSSGPVTQRAGGDTSSATDGDLDITLAFIHAWQSWNDESYKNYAQTILDNLRTKIFTFKSHPSLGDWVTPGSSFEGVTRPSDFMIEHFHEFKTFDSTNSAFWQNVITSLTTTLQNLSNQFNSGLIPDFLQWSGQQFSRVPGKILESENDKNYFYNSCRLPWRLAALLTKRPSDPLVNVAKKMMQFFDSQETIFSGYTLEGQPLNDYQDLAFIGPITALAKLYSNKYNMYLQLANTLDSEYYGSTLFLLAQSISRNTTIPTPTNTPIQTTTITSTNTPIQTTTLTTPIQTTLINTQTTLINTSTTTLIGIPTEC